MGVLDDFDVVWDGAHRGSDADLFSPVSWPKREAWTTHRDTFHEPVKTRARPESIRAQAALILSIFQKLGPVPVTRVQVRALSGLCDQDVGIVFVKLHREGAIKRIAFGEWGLT